MTNKNNQRRLMEATVCIFERL